MNTDILTTPSPELKKHINDLRQSATKITNDVKKQAVDGFEEVKSEANSRLQDVKGTASDLFDSLKNFATENPFKVFSLGIVTGIVLARWRKH